MNKELIDRIRNAHAERFGVEASVLSFAPGRVEVLGNHTDYNEGFVLSMAIDPGIAAAFSPCHEHECVLHALDEDAEIRVALPVSGPVEKPVWANYIIGVLAGLNRFGLGKHRGGFQATFAGDIPIAAGLSSSAALETAAALGFCALADITMPELETAKLCQAAEHGFVGTRCGLLDQISVLFGKANALVFSDFRSLQVETAAIGAESCFLVADTGVRHNLVESEYNERRKSCEQAAAFFDSALEHPVKALRDVSLDEWKRFSPEMEPVAAKRAAHIIEENHRVLEGRNRLFEGDVAGFGRLMFQSHESSRVNFENSCEELDVIVNEARNIKTVAGARLSGGGFGGSVVMLLHPNDATRTAKIVSNRCEAKLGKPCNIRLVRPSNGARLLVSAGTC